MQVILKAPFIIDGSVLALDAKQPKNRKGAYQSNLMKFKPNKDNPGQPVAMLDEFRPYLPSTAIVVKKKPRREGDNGPDRWERVHVGPRFYEDQSAEEFFEEWDRIHITKPKKEENEFLKIKAQRKERATREAIKKAAADALYMPGGNLSRADEVANVAGEDIDVGAPKRGPGRPRKDASA